MLKVQKKRRLTFADRAIFVHLFIFLRPRIA